MSIDNMTVGEVANPCIYLYRTSGDQRLQISRGSMPENLALPFHITLLMLLFHSGSFNFNWHLQSPDQKNELRHDLGEARP